LHFLQDFPSYTYCVIRKFMNKDNEIVLRHLRHRGRSGRYGSDKAFLCLRGNLPQRNGNYRHMYLLAFRQTGKGSFTRGSSNNTKTPLIMRTIFLGSGASYSARDCATSLCSKFSAMRLPALLPAPMAEMTVAAPVTMSPPA